MGVLTRRGNYLNFRRVLPHEQNTFGAWWFLGRFRSLHRDRWREILGRKGRVHVLPDSLGITVCLTGYFALWLLWFFAWAVYPIWFTVSGAARALARRFSRSRILDRVLTRVFLGRR